MLKLRLRGAFRAVHTKELWFKNSRVESNRVQIRILNKHNFFAKLNFLYPLVWQILEVAVLVTSKLDRMLKR